MVTGESQRQMDTILKVDRAIKNIWLNLYNDSNCSWFDGRQTSKWAKGRVTELLGYWDEKDEEFTVKVNAYNNLNLDVI